MTTNPTLFAYYTSPTTPTAASFVVDVTGAIRLGSITGLAGEAELGAVGAGNIVLDDPTSTLGHLGDGIVGLKQFHFNENACPVGNRRLWSGYVGDRRYHRGQGDSLITGAARKIDVTLVDINSFLSFRVFAPTALDSTSDFDRPAETDLERIAAMLTTVDFLSTTLFDIGYIPTTGGVALDANDYTGQRPVDVLNDCAQASGRNFFVLYDEASGHNVLWYDKWTTDGSTTKTYDSALRLTNVLSEVNNTTTFPDDMNAVEVLDPSRVVSAVYLPFDNKTESPAYRTLPSTANTFAWRDSIAPSVQVKTLAKANALGDRYLLENSTEDSRISCTVRLPREYVTGIHEGMRLQVHFTHLPLVSSGFTWTRVLQRTIRQDQETQFFYWLDLELSPIPETCPDAIPAGFYGPNLGTTAIGLGLVNYWKPGWPAVQGPAPGFVGSWHFPAFNVAGIDYPGDCTENAVRCIVVGDGTITVHTVAAAVPHLLTAQLFTAPSTTADEERHGIAAGSDITFLISTDGQVNCTHVIVVTDAGNPTNPCGSAAFGFAGFDWAPA